MAQEIPKELKVIWLVNSIIGFIFAVLYIFFYESLGGTDALTPFSVAAAQSGRIVGFTTLLLGIFCIRLYLTDDWAKVQFYFEFGILWLICGLVVNIWATVFLPVSTTTVARNIVIIIILAGLLVPYIYYYLQLRE